MNRRKPLTLVDYLLVAIAPALIMLLIGSLMFFLIMVLYRGNYPGRLQTIAALFVFAAVLIGRIAIEEGKEYAQLFAMALGLATLLAIMRLVENGVLVGIILVIAAWWSAQRLTWDCTVIDHDQDTSGRGLLENWHSSQAVKSLDSDDEAQAESATTENKWFAWLMKRKANHSPGMTVVYFCLASLPIFGLGQWLLPSRFLPVRREAFHLLVVYVAAALALLMVTSFLQLRRYLRQRNVDMPLEMTGTWLTVGTTLIVAVLVACLGLPRLSPEYSISHLSVFQSPTERQGRPDESDWALGDEGHHQDDATRSGNDNQYQPQPDEPNSGSRTDESSQRPNSSNQTSDQRETVSDGSADENADGTGDRNSDNGQPSGTGQGDAANSQQTTSPNEQDDLSSDGSQKSQQSGQGQGPNQNQASRDQSEQSAPNSQRPSAGLLQQLGSWAGRLIQAVYWLAVLALAIWFVWRYHATIARFLQELRDWWAKLWGRAEKSDAAVLTEANHAEPGPRFPAFLSEYRSGSVARMPLHELVTFSFAATEAWAADQTWQRTNDETAFEFAESLAQRCPELAPVLLRLPQYVGVVQYSQRKLTDKIKPDLVQLWNYLVTHPPQPQPTSHTNPL